MNGDLFVGFLTMDHIFSILAVVCDKLEGFPRCKVGVGWWAFVRAPIRPLRKKRGGLWYVQD